MTHQQKEQITALRSQGYGYATIAKAIGLKKDTVVAFCRKVGLTGTKAADNSRIELDAGFCRSAALCLRRLPAESASSSAPITAVPLGGMHILKRLTARPYTTLLAFTAESPSPPTAIQKENTALTPAILQTATKAVTGMSEDKFRSEMSYLAALSIAKNLREKGLLSEEEYAVIDTNLRAEFSPSLGTLLSENDLI